MFGFKKSITINRSPHEVFQFVANPENNSLWRSDVVETKYRSLPLGEGDRYEEKIDFGGVRDCVIEVVEVIADRKLAMETISGVSYLPMRVLTFEAEGGHTKVTAKISAHNDGFTRIMEPIPSNLFSVRWDNYLFSLKRVLEQQPH